MSYASGRRSKAISDRSGQAFPYKEIAGAAHQMRLHLDDAAG